MWQSVYRSFSVSLGYHILRRKLGADCTVLPIERAAYNKEIIEKINCLRTADISFILYQFFKHLSSIFYLIFQFHFIAILY